MITKTEKGYVYTCDDCGKQPTADGDCGCNMTTMTNAVFHDLGALAQAARNYLIADSKENKAVLDRLAAEALGAERLYALCLDCGALVDWGCSCPECRLGEDF